eukprot:9748045-Karenia_brevis.AAC.1
MDEDDEDEEDPPELVESSDEGEDDEGIPSDEELKNMKKEWEEVRRSRNKTGRMCGGEVDMWSRG